MSPPAAMETGGRRRGRSSRRTALLGAAGAVAAGALAACGRADGPGAHRTGGPPTRRQAHPPSRHAPGASTRHDADAATHPGGTVGLGVIGVFVADLAASLAFYRRLGLAVPRDVDPAAGSFRLALPSGQIFFWETLAYTRRDFPDYRPAVGDRKVALEFGFATPRDVDAMHARLVAAGSLSVFPPTTWGAIRYAVVTDPDDNQIALRFPLSP